MAPRSVVIALLFVFASTLLLSALAVANDETRPSGEQIAAQGVRGVAACAGCHGVKGEGQVGSGTPRLAAISAGYLGRQLQAFADGTRNHAVMSPIAKGLSPEAMQNVAAYYATLPPPQTPAQDASARQIAAGAVLAWRGDWPHKIPACRSCHGAKGLAVGKAIPPLVGQPAKYVAAALDAWKGGTRRSDPQNIMSTIAQRLDAEQIASVAAFYATKPLPPPPADPRLPEGEFGEIVRQGAAIFNDTPAQARGHIGNELTCANCHLDAGRLADSAPMGAAFVKYPMFRKKEGRVLNFSERLQGCFRYSMNGKPPALGDNVLVALESYAFFLAKGAPVGTTLPGQGYPIPPKPALGTDFERGATVFKDRCALCHGTDGQGQRAENGAVVFPALWGAGSFNWGAGMHEFDKAAGFIKANMPLSQGNSLSDQEAWDVAYFIDSHERPQDPRFAGDVTETRRRFHDKPTSNYGKTVAGILLGRDSPPSGPQPAATR